MLKWEPIPGAYGSRLMAGSVVVYIRPGRGTGWQYSLFLLGCQVGPARPLLAVTVEQAQAESLALVRVFLRDALQSVGGSRC
jgi:hypothetical protein